MINKSIRNKQIAQEIKRNIAIILKQYIKDPRINIATTVSNVRVSYDYTYAKVLVTFLHTNNSEQIKISINILQNAAGYIQNILCKIMKLKSTPKLLFIYDHSLIEGMKIYNIINHVIQNDCLRYKLSNTNN